MALRGWRFIGVAGTIIVYVAGILVLSIVSLNSPNPRRSRAGRFGEFEHINKQRESNLLGKRQPLQWCQELKFKDNINNIKNNAVLHSSQKPIKVMQTFPGHFVRYNKYVVLRNLNEKFDDKFIDNSVAIESKQRINNEIKLNVEKLWQSNKEKTILEQQNDIRKNIDKDNNNNNNIKLPPPKLIALASFPGSGNTWLRYLLQQSTGILTGSVYKDFGLLKSGFPGEHVFNSSVLVVKTHEWGPNSWGNFSKAILLIRDPDKAILAEFNRQSGGHVGFASPDRYKRTKGRYWQQFVTNKLWAWEQMNMQWAKNFTGDVLIVYYDDLVENVEVLLRKILNFINFPIDEELLSCALLRKEGIYRRKKRMNSFDPYTPEMHRALNEIQKEVYTALGRF